MLMLRKLLRDLRQRPLSLSALVVVAAIGVACYVGMASVIVDLREARDRYYRDLRLADWWIDLRRAPSWTAEAVSRLPNVRDAEGRVSLPVRVRLEGVEEPLCGYAISLPRDRRPRINDLNLTAGTWPDASRREALVLDAFARARHLRPGDRIGVILLDEMQTFVVSGLVGSPEFVFVAAPGTGFVPDPERSVVLYLPERLLQESGDLDGAWNQIVGRARDPSPAPLRALTVRLEESLDPYGVTYATPASEQASVRFLDNELRELAQSARVVPLICLAVVAVVLSVVLRRVVAQQQIVIGTLRALGYGSGFLVVHYGSYGLLVGVASGLIGDACGVWLQHVLVGRYAGFFALPGMTATFQGDVLAQGLAVAVLFSLAGSVSAVRFALRLQPAVAMRPLPPEKGARIMFERIPFIWNRLPFRARMIARSIFRSPFRSVVTIGSTVVATALMVETLSMVSSLNFMIEHEFVSTQRQDLTVGVRDVAGPEVRHEMDRLPGIEGIELQLSVVCDLSHGPWSKRVGVSGLPPRPRLARPLDAGGQAISVPAAGLVISRKLAEVLGVRPGEEVICRPLIGERRVTRAAVAAVVDTYIGLAAYADAAYLARLVGEEGASSTVLVRVRPGARTAPLLSALDERPAVVSVERRGRALERIDELLGETIGSSLMVLIAFAGLLGFGGVLNTALVSLNERLREVGTLRVLGYSPLAVLAIFSGESVALSALGVGIGVFAGIGLVHLVSRGYDTELFRLPPVVTASDLGQAAALVLAFILLAQGVVLLVVLKTDWLSVFKVRD